MQAILLLEDSYDFKWLYYHKYMWNNVKCWHELGNNCIICEKWIRRTFLSIIKIYDRQEQKVKMIYLNQNSFWNLHRLLQYLINNRTLTYNLSDTKNNIFEINKKWYDYEFKYLRKHNYKTFNLNDNIDINNYIKRNYTPYDCYWNDIINNYKHLIHEDIKLEWTLQMADTKEELKSSAFIPIKIEYINNDDKLNEFNDLFDKL